MKTREQLVEALIAAHKSYLSSLDNLPVEKRQKLGNDSVKRYETVMQMIEKNEMTDDDIEFTISSIRAAEIASVKSDGLRGTCSELCQGMMYGLQVACNILIATKFPMMEASGLCSLIAEMIKRTNIDCMKLAASSMSDAEVHDMVHARIAKTIISLTDIQKQLSLGKTLNDLESAMSMSNWGPTNNLKN